MPDAFRVDDRVVLDRSHRHLAHIDAAQRRAAHVVVPDVDHHPVRDDPFTDTGDACSSSIIDIPLSIANEMSIPCDPRTVR